VTFKRTRESFQRDYAEKEGGSVEMKNMRATPALK
jgi:hypothetical protein